MGWQPQGSQDPYFTWSPPPPLGMIGARSPLPLCEVMPPFAALVGIVLRPRCSSGECEDAQRSRKPRAKNTTTKSGAKNICWHVVNVINEINSLISASDNSSFSIYIA